MAVITVRSLPDDVRDGLRTLASARGTSVEGLARIVLAEASKQAGASGGMAEVQQPLLGPYQPAIPASSTAPGLWGALRGTVRVSEGLDLAAPSGEAWEAEG